MADEPNPAPAPAPAPTEPPKAEDKTEAEKPEGWGQVDLTTLPPEVQHRFHRVYGQMKRSYGELQLTKADLKNMGTVNRQLLSRLEELEAKFEGKNAEEKADMIKARLAQANEKGDFVAVAELQDQLTKLRTTKPEPKKAQVQQPQVNAAALTEEQEEVIVDWAQAADDAGNFKRPWAQEGHRRHGEMSEVVTELMADRKLRARGIGAILSEVDKRMGLTASRGVAAVLSGDGGRPPEKKESLTTEEKRIAKLMNIPEDRYLKNKKHLATGNRSSAHAS